MAFDLWDADHNDPDVQEGLKTIEAGIMRVLKGLADDDDADITQIIPVAWAVGVEVLGYNEEGRAARSIDVLFPLGQSMSATRGALINANEGLGDNIFGVVVDDEE